MEKPRYKRHKNTGNDRSPHIVVADDMTKLWSGVNDALLWAKRDRMSYWSSLDTMISDCIGVADKGNMEMNIGQELWVTMMRWSTLIRQYVDPERLFAWLEGVKQISTYNRGIAALDMNPVSRTVVTSNARANRRKWGGCMRMATYRAFPQPTVTLFSRTSYLGYIGGLDMLLAHKLIELAADMIGEGLKPEDFQFRWMCDTWQFHGFKSMSYIFASGQDQYMRKRWPEDELGPVEDYPTWVLVRYWWKRLHKQDKEVKLYQDMKYSAEKRIRRRYHAQTGVDQSPFLGDEKEYLPLNIPKSVVNLDRMIYKTPESRAVIRKQKEENARKLVGRIFEDDSFLEAL